MDLSISFSLCAVMDLSIYKKVGIDEPFHQFFSVCSDGTFHQFFLWVVMDLSIYKKVGSDEPFHQFFSVCSDGPFYI